MVENKNKLVEKVASLLKEASEERKKYSIMTHKKNPARMMLGLSLPVAVGTGIESAAISSINTDNIKRIAAIGGIGALAGAGLGAAAGYGIHRRAYKNFKSLSEKDQKNYIKLHEHLTKNKNLPDSEQLEALAKIYKIMGR